MTSTHVSSAYIERIRRDAQLHHRAMWLARVCQVVGKGIALPLGAALAVTGLLLHDPATIWQALAGAAGGQGLNLWAGREALQHRSRRNYADAEVAKLLRERALEQDAFDRSLQRGCDRPSDPARPVAHKTDLPTHAGSRAENLVVITPETRVVPGPTVGRHRASTAPTIREAASR